MSTARHHAEWLSLVEVSGPFLSMSVLCRVFPDGLDKRADEPALRERVKLAYDEWQESLENPKPDPAIHHAWVRFLLREALELERSDLVEGQALPTTLAASLPQHGETLRPALALLEEGTKRPRLLVDVWPPEQDLDATATGKRWKASPATRMMTLLRETGVRLGLVTNGEELQLVHTHADEPTTYASFYANLFLEEPLTLRAFSSLLSRRRFFGVPDGETIEALFSESQKDQQEVTDQLGYQVRRAVEVLIQTFDRLDRDSGRTLLRQWPEPDLYDAAVTVMMRLVFLFAAEERELLLSGDPLWDQHYGVANLRAQLQEQADQHGEEVLERRHDAWARLLATFRAVHGGVDHERLRLLAYGGGLFDPDRYPFLEGRARGSEWRKTPASPLAVDNRTVLHLLRALQMLEVKIPGGGPAEARRLSFRALGVEQIGHVYEGLLDHTAIRARGPVLGLRGSKNQEPELLVVVLEDCRKQGKDELLEYLRGQTGRSVSALGKDLACEIPREHHQRWLAACGNDRKLLDRVRPWAGLVRRDASGYPVVIQDGSLYVTQGTERRSTGTHYTPVTLTEPIVRHTLDPLVYTGPPEGWPEADWKLRSADEILALRVCDFTMGSGAFLVQACRYLSERLCESWADAESEHGERISVAPGATPSEGHPTERTLPKDPDERLAVARRLVADRCLYGVDKNPAAVEMAKLSLWLVTLQKDRPFTFVDHALRCGDSLLGLTDPAQLELFHIDPSIGTQVPTGALVARPALARAMALREKLRSFPVETARDAEEKARLLDEALTATADVHLVADLLVGAALSNASRGADALESRLRELSRMVGDAFGEKRSKEARRSAIEGLRAPAEAMLRPPRPDLAPRRPFHWAIEFPEVFCVEAPERRGFDAIVGNPPFQGGQRITGALGTDYRDYLVEHLGAGKRGSADLCAYFFLRAGALLNARGGVGLLATNTIAQGDTREVGLQQLVERGFTFVRAVPSRAWPGAASLEVAHVWFRRHSWKGPFVLDEQAVPAITPLLARSGNVEGEPYRLAANAGKSFQGSIVLGMGFVMKPEDATAFIKRNVRNRDVLFPYLNGEDLNSRTDQSASRWVINFRDWPIEKARVYRECFEIVLEKVKPERDRNNRKIRRERWWQFAERAPDLYATISGLERVVVRTQVSKHHAFAHVANGQVLDQRLVCIATDEHSVFAILQSALHEHWGLLYGATLETRPTYTPTTCFESFPFPLDIKNLDTVGRRYADARRATMKANDEGLTKTYNRLHDPQDPSREIADLRELTIELDRAVGRAYGWDDLALDHGFHQTKQGLRFTISEPARHEVLDRLLELNHQRNAEELAQGLHDEPERRRAARVVRQKEPKTAPAAAQSIFDFGAAPTPPGAPRRKRSPAKE